MWAIRRLPVPKRLFSARALLSAIAVLGLLVAGLVLWFSGDQSRGNSAPAGKTVLTHAERVVLTAEQMHTLNYRAASDDSLETQLKNAVTGEHGFSSPHSRVTSEWRLKAFDDGLCTLQAEARGAWSSKAARVVAAEFNRFANTLCPDAARKTESLLHYVRDDLPEETKAGGYDVRVTLFEQSAGTADQWWQLLVELQPLANQTLARSPNRKSIPR